jgi:hypothetical protein
MAPARGLVYLAKGDVETAVFQLNKVAKLQPKLKDTAIGDEQFRSLKKYNEFKDAVK